MFLDLASIKNQPGITSDFTEQLSIINLHSIDLVLYEKKILFLKDGKALWHLDPRRYRKNSREYEEYDVSEVDIITFKKWQRRTNLSCDDLVIYFAPEAKSEYKKIRSILQGITCK